MELTRVMRRTRRHRFLKLSIFFLIYSIYHVILVQSENKEETPSIKTEHETANKNPAEKTDIQPPTESKHSEHKAETKVPLTETKDSKQNAEKTHTEVPPEVKNSEQKAEKTEVKEPPQEESKQTKNKHDSKFSGMMKMLSTGGKNAEESVGKHIKNITENEKKTEELTNESKSIPEGTEKIGDDLKNQNKSKSKFEHAVGGIVEVGKSIISVVGNITKQECIPAAIKQFPRPLMSPKTRRHGGLIIHVIVAMYMFIGLAIVCDEYFVASLDRICEELKMSPDVAGATFMAAGSSAPELATVIIGVFFAEDDIGISGVIGSAVFNIMFVISVCALATGAAIYLNWWPLIRDCTFYSLAILVMLAVMADENIYWYESLIMLITYIIYCIALHYNTPLEQWAMTLPVPFKKVSPNEQSGLVSFKKLEDETKHPTYGIDNVETIVPEKQEKQWSPGQEWGDWSPEKNQQRNNMQQDFQQQSLEGPALNQVGNEIPIQDAAVPAAHEYYRPKEYDPSAYVNPLLKPIGGGIWAQIKWVVLYPIHFLCIYTTPNCRTEKYKNWYVFTFIMSMLWISFYSYFMVWMITIIGFTLNIPDTVMGLTFVAAGVSVPDALSSIAVIKEGYGDMAVSNAIGSNVFDILICLGLPWFLKTAVIYPGGKVRVISRGLTYSTLSLLSTVVFLVVAIHYNGWKLDRRFGIVLMVWYLVFITFASLYELNIFGDWNMRECPSDW